MTDPRDPGVVGGGNPDPWAPWGRPGYAAPPYGYEHPPPGYPAQYGTQYGPPVGYPGYPYPPGHPPAPRPQLQFGLIAAGLAGLGAAMVLLALVGLDWYSFQGGQSVADVRHLLDGTGTAANGLAVAYYSWLGWSLLVLSAVSAGIAALPVHGLSLAFRITGPILAGLAVLFTAGSVELTNSDLAGNDALRAFYYDHVALGFWIALIGFVLIGAGAIVGPMRRKPQ